MDSGIVAIPTVAPQQNDGAPSFAAFIYGSPSPSNPSLTQSVQTGNSFGFSFGDFINTLEKKSISAVTTVTDQAKYKGDIVLGTIAKTYNQALAAGYGAVADTGTAVIAVAKKVETGSTLLFVAIAAFLLFPYIMAMRKR